MATPEEIARDSLGTIIRKINALAETACHSNVLLVDCVVGSDIEGEVGGHPFKTIEGALVYISLHSLTEVTVWIMPGNHAVSAGFAMPATCSLRGFSLQVCSITLVTSVSTTMVTMGENSRIEDLTLTLLSSSDTADLTLVELPGTTSITSKIRTCVLNVDNAGIPTGSTTNVYGFHVTGAGVLGPATFSFNHIRSTTLNLRSNGGGNKYGIYLPPTSSGCQISLRDSNVYVAAPRDPSSTGTYAGVCVDNANSQIQLRTTSVSGVPYLSSTTHPSVRVLSVTNLALSGLPTLQEITLVSGDRILLAGQTTASQNGIWVVSSGAWSRPADMAVGSNASGAWVLVNEGTYALQKWLCYSYPAVVGTNSLSWLHTYVGVEVKLPVLARYTGGAPTGARPAQGSCAPVDGDRLFLDQAADAVNNGIWVYNSTGAWSRSGDMPASINSLNSYISVAQGDYGDLAYICTTTGGVGTTPLTFALKYTGADILQKSPRSGNVPNGIHIGPGVDLITKSTGGKPFTTYTMPITLVYGFKGNIPNGTRYMWQGLQTTLDTTQVFYRFQQSVVVQGVSLITRNTDLGAKTLKATLLKSVSGMAGQGVPTPLSVMVTDGIYQAENYGVSVQFERGSFLAVELAASASINPGDLVLEIDAY